MGMKRMFWRSDSVITEEGENSPPPTHETKHLRRRMKLILTLTLSGALGGFLVSYVLPTRYQTQSTVLVEGQKVPDSYVSPIITSDFVQRMPSLSQEVESPARLRSMLKDYGIVNPEEQSKLIVAIQQNMQVEPVITSLSEAADAYPTAKKDAPATYEPVPGFNVVYTDTDPVRAQKLCNAMTSSMVDENLRSRSEAAQSTVDFLSHRVEDARRSLIEQGTRLGNSNSHSPRSPREAAEYKVLAVDYEVAEAFYKDLLAKESAAGLGASLENQQEGEQMHIAAAAYLPEDPVFPDRRALTLWGLGAGLLLGIGRLLWPATRKLFQQLALLFPIDTQIE
jgi:uncharacterized protein involved in exopolysaccharide biosynthesis